MTSYTSSRESDLEILLSFVGRHLGEAGAIATVDLYADQGMASGEARCLFEELKRKILSSGGKGRKREDPLMGVVLDLSSEEGIRQFCLLGFRTIGCEAFVGNDLVLASVENERTIWLDFPESVVSELESSARGSGASGLMRR
ncbi:hypothetical protein [Streptomyces sp. URMC 125]|uniref:hypothetical protein n=1 Tax=Streptomyces sp. URMC 125 TaxID=3423419 RepID=UPI003F1C505B